MIKYYAQVKVGQTDAGGQLVGGMYRADAPKVTTDVLICTTPRPLAAYERFCNMPVNWADFALADGKIVSSFAVLKAQKLERIDGDYAAALAAGVTVGGITLAAEEGDQNIFSRFLTMLATAEGLQADDATKAAFCASMQTVADHSGAPHSMTVTDLRGLIVQYGAAVQALWTTKATRRAQAAAAITVAALNAI